MRVIFNALSSYRLRTGVGSYAAQLAAQLKRRSGGAVTTFPEGWMAPLALLAGRAMKQRQKTRGVASHILPKSLRVRLRRTLRFGMKDLSERAFRRACRSGDFDLYHEPNFIPWECDLPTVVTVHDLSVIHHPEWHPPERVALHERHFAETLKRCRHILTVSEAMRREIVATMGVPWEQVTAVPNGVRSDVRPMSASEIAPVRTRLGLPDDYLLYVGTIEPRKNVLTLLRAYCALDDATRSRCPLVLAGQWGWGYEREEAFLNNEAKHRGVIHLGYVADADLPAVYAGAAALVYPSHYEGFGLPPVEMMACGGAVLASTDAAVREVCGEAAHFIDANDECGWRDAMRRLICDAEWRSQLRRDTVERASRFSWVKCADETWQTYQQVLSPLAKAA
jgi:glycosyltransferase involved in cell wall biosynthesis